MLCNCHQWVSTLHWVVVFKLMPTFKVQCKLNWSVFQMFWNRNRISVSSCTPLHLPPAGTPKSFRKTKWNHFWETCRHDEELIQISNPMWDLEYQLKNKQTKKYIITIPVNIYTLEKTPLATKPPSSLCSWHRLPHIYSAVDLWPAWCWLGNFPKPEIIATNTLIFRNKIKIPYFLFFSHLAQFPTDNFITPLSSSASCPLLSFLINPSITFLVSFHVPQASAFMWWQQQRREYTEVCVCVCSLISLYRQKLPWLISKSGTLNSDGESNTTANSGSSVLRALRSPLGEAQFWFPSLRGSGKGCVSSVRGWDAF